MKKIVLNVDIQDIKYTDDSSRKSKLCEKCKQPTTGRVGRTAMCLECTVRLALLPISSVLNILKTGLQETDQ